MIDANFNRVKEGLRVSEDVSRFICEDARLTRAFKRLRHDVSQTLLRFPVPYRVLVRTRASQRDVGVRTKISDQGHIGWNGLAIRNLKRAQEGLRVLEEACEVLHLAAASRFHKFRFRAYGLEKRLLSQFPPVRHHGPRP